MTKDEHNALLTQLRTATDVDRLLLISQLEQDYTGVLGQVEQTSQNLEKVTKERDSYALSNSDLWGRLTDQSKKLETTTIEGTEEQHENEPPQKMTYEALKDKFD